MPMQILRDIRTFLKVHFFNIKGYCFPAIFFLPPLTICITYSEQSRRVDTEDADAPTGNIAKTAGISRKVTSLFSTFLLFPAYLYTCDTDAMS